MTKFDKIEHGARSASVKIQEINDAILLGNDCPEFEELMRTPATLTAGEVYTGKRRGTRDDKWDPETRPWVDWIVGDNDKWGLSIHAQTPRKDGPGTVFGACNTYRRKNAVTSVAALALDLDTGHHTFDQVTELVEKLDRAAIIYTTHSHLTERATLKFDEVVKHTKCDGDPTTADVQRYMREKKNTAPHICDGSEVLEIDKEAKDGWEIIVKTPPIPKMRVIFPLKEAKKISDLGATQKAALDAYKATVLALGEMLGVIIDEACTDPSRFFYRPAHKKDAPHQTVIFQAPPLTWGEVKIDADPFAINGSEGGSYAAERRPDAICEDGTNATRLYQDYGKRMLLAELCEGHGLGTSANAQNGGGKFHTVCPFNHEHTDSADDTATFAVDADQSEHGYAIIKCMHASCAQRKTADFLAGYIDNGDLSVDDILDSGYLLPPDDDAGEKYNRLTPEEKEDAGLITLEKREHVTEAVAQLGDAPEQEAIDDLIARVSGPLSPVILEELAQRLKTASGLPIAEVRKMLKHLRTPKTQNGDFPLIAVDDDYRAAREEALAVMVEQDPPSLFHNGGRMVEIAEDEHENLSMKDVGKDVFKARMEARMDFMSEGAVKDAPNGLVNYVYQQPLTGYPALHRVTHAPVFGADKTLVTTPGYHPNTGLYYQPKSGVRIAPPSAQPTEDEVFTCVDDLVDLFADFPLDAMTRDELEAAIENGDDVPSLCHLLSVALTPMCRAMIEGPTPLHMFRKDKPRSGATLATSVATKIGTLDYAIPQTFPASKEEVSKTIVATLDAGPGYVFFDNLPDDGKIESGELAAAITAWPEYQGRRLGVSVMVRLKITAAWIGTGNRTALSEELAERALLVEIDPQMEKPGKRDKALFKYDLSSHAPANAGHYYHCLLTLVQNWIAKGCPEWQGDCLGGFERHAAVIGGILEAAGVHGFMGNAAKMRATVASTNPEHALLDAMIEAHNKQPTVFRVSGNEAPPKEVGPKGDRKPFKHAGARVVSIMELLNTGAIAIKHWGYVLEDGDATYPSSAKKTVAQKLADITGTVREWGEAETEKEHLRKRYVLEKVYERNGALYALKALDRVTTDTEKS
ncbi:hypothetical protein SAMN04488092_105202 [Thalassovita taeanensis]|uniref:Uncharacterized protein n=1 Tax=Thalassovita taeanensis TaxID=657014 RepID=A0A1H9EWJ7_9RHOB|nr:hypothetical protein SAMN04488092_105202 [Thalassovita taeanensis]